MSSLTFLVVAFLQGDVEKDTSQPKLVFHRVMDVRVVLWNEDARKDLEITQSQWDELSEAGKEFGLALKEVSKEVRYPSGQRYKSKEEVLEVNRKYTAEMRERLAGATATYRKRLDETLLPCQKHRLNQLSVQFCGVSGLLRPDVREELVLSEEQAASITKVIGDTNGRTRLVLDAKQRRELIEEGLRAALSHLTPVQRAKFRQLSGEPLKRNY